MAFGWDKIEKCDICGDEVRNIGHHKHFHHSERPVKEKVEIKPEPIKDGNKIEVDQDFISTPLSMILTDLRRVLNQYQNRMEIKISEQNGKPFEVQIVTTIKI